MFTTYYEEEVLHLVGVTKALKFAREMLELQLEYEVKFAELRGKPFDLDFDVSAQVLLYSLRQQNFIIAGGTSQSV